jgi:hypothetical protein
MVGFTGVGYSELVPFDDSPAAAIAPVMAGGGNRLVRWLDGAWNDIPVPPNATGLSDVWANPTLAGELLLSGVNDTFSFQYWATQSGGASWSNAYTVLDPLFVYGGIAYDNIGVLWGGTTNNGGTEKIYRMEAGAWGVTPTEVFSDTPISAMSSVFVGDAYVWYAARSSPVGTFNLTRAALDGSGKTRSLLGSGLILHQIWGDRAEGDKVIATTGASNQIWSVVGGIVTLVSPTGSGSGIFANNGIVKGDVVVCALVNPTTHLGRIVRSDDFGATWTVIEDWNADLENSDGVGGGAGSTSHGGSYQTGEMFIPGSGNKVWRSADDGLTWTMETVTSGPWHFS